MIEPRNSTSVIQRQVAPDLYFVFDFDSSNAAFLVTDEGVLVIDTRQHPDDGRDLISRIRAVTSKPIKWVVNTHFHGDHHFGNSALKETGATTVAQEETDRLMQSTFKKELSRGKYFQSRGYDPAEVKLTPADVTFKDEMVIRLGEKEIRLM